MAVFAYLLLPLSGTVAYLVGRSTRVRFHGLQAIAVGGIWAIAVYVGSWLSPSITRVTFAAGALVWLFLIVATLFGRDVRLPGLAFLTGVARDGVKDD